MTRRLDWTRLGMMTRALMVVVLGALLAPLDVAGQSMPDPRPEPVPYYYDETGTFPEHELATLRRDAKLLQSSEIPTLVYVREVDSDEASLEQSQAFADALREEWGIESAEGADDGLVLLYSWVPENPTASTVVQSYGPATFEGSGLSPESIQETIDTSVRSLIAQREPFETLVYLMRETRYTGIYAPPPPSPIEGTARSVHDALEWIGPALTGAAAVILAMLSVQFWRQGPDARQIWTIAGVTSGCAFLLWLVAVYARSATGAMSTLLTFAILAIAVWLWTHAPFTARHADPMRRRSVPATRRRMRKRIQTRRMFVQPTGGRR